MTDDPILLFYLLILLIGVGSFIFGGWHNRVAQWLKDALIWALIFVAVVAGFSFKDTLQAEFFPTQAAVHEGGAIVLNRMRDGHFYASLNINGQTVDFVVDTGATGVVLNQSDATRIGLDTGNLRFLGRARTANGVVETAPVRLDTVEFEGRVDRNLPASVNGGELDTSLLGMSYLSRFARIEIEGNQMRLVP